MVFSKKTINFMVFGKPGGSLERSKFDVFFCVNDLKFR